MLKNKGYKDFKCDCGCDQKIRVAYHGWKNGYIIDLGFIRGKEKLPKIGIVLESDGKLWDFIERLPKRPPLKITKKEMNKLINEGLKALRKPQPQI